MTHLDKKKKIDRKVGEFLCNILGRLPKPSEFPEPKKILVVRLWTIGESILIMPMIRLLKEKYPDARIDVLVARSREIFEMNKDVNIVKFGFMNLFRFREYDLAIDTEPFLNLSAIMSFYMAKRRIGFSHGARAQLYTDVVDFNDQQHEVKTFVDLIRVLRDFEYPKRLVKLEVEADEKRIAEKYLRDHGIKGDYIGIAPGVAESAKIRMWPVKKWAKLCDEILEKHNIKIVFFGSSNDRVLIRKIRDLMFHRKKTVNSAGFISLQQVTWAIQNSKVFISVDSGLLHLAAAQNVRTVGLFGPNTPVRFAPYGMGNRYVYHPSKPIINVHKGEVPDKDPGNTMDKITVKEVLDVFESVFED